PLGQLSLLSLARHAHLETSGNRDVGQMDQRVHPVKGGPVVAELELGNAGGRDLERPEPVGSETERLQDEDAAGDAVRDQADSLALMGGAKPLEPGEGPGAQVLERL